MKTAKDGDERLMKNPPHLGQARESLLIPHVSIPTSPSGGEKGALVVVFPGLGANSRLALSATGFDSPFA